MHGNMNVKDGPPYFARTVSYARKTLMKLTISLWLLKPGNTKGGSITLPLTSYLTGLDSAVWQLTIFVFISQNRLIKTKQTGGQQYSDTCPFSIPCSNRC